MTPTLRDLLMAAKLETGLGFGELTVLSAQNDPYRIDTPTFHEAGRWFAAQLDRLSLHGKHLRGIHYALLGSTSLPNGEPYHNTAEAWEWLQNVASKAGRWLGYVRFEDIRDGRNAAPLIMHALASRPTPALRVIPELTLPDDLTPRVELNDFMPRQRHHLVFWAEKSSADEVLGPMATYSYQADLYLPTGESSDTMLALMAREGEADGRPMVVFVVADCDPSGYQMATSIGHKLRALRDSIFPRLAFKVLCPAVTVEQVKELGLPSTPLKETEKRAARWQEMMGVEQTELDALLVRPDEFRRIMRKAIKPYWDPTLEDRARSARDDWEAEAQAAFEAQVDPEQMATLRAQAEEAVENLKARLADLDLATEGLDIDWPTISMPDPICSGDGPNLVNSDMPLPEAIRILRARKKYD